MTDPKQESENITQKENRVNLDRSIIRENFRTIYTTQFQQLDSLTGKSKN
jgi:hypothetical protein